MRKENWEILLALADRQAERVETERPGIKFLQVMGVLLAQDKVVLLLRIGDDGEKPAPHQELIGYRDENYVFLLPEAAHKAFVEFCRRQGQPCAWNSLAIRKDLERLGLLDHTDGRLTDVGRLSSRVTRVLRIPNEKWKQWTSMKLDE